jgi:hypothetical protein
MPRVEQSLAPSEGSPRYALNFDELSDRRTDDEFPVLGYENLSRNPDARGFRHRAGR